MRPPASIIKAEGEGFEPSNACALPVFKTGAIGHSATPPALHRTRVTRRLAHRFAILFFVFALPLGECHISGDMNEEIDAILRTWVQEKSRRMGELRTLGR